MSGFYISVAETGERKSSCDREALWPIRKREEKLREAYDIDLPAWRNKQDAWEKQRSQIVADKKHYGTLDAKEAALDDLGPAPTAPLDPMLTCPEPTYEGLCRMLAQGQPSVGLFSDEGGQFIGGHGMSEDHRLKTGAALSSLWDGQPIRRVRAGDGTIILPGRRVSMHLMAQPNVAAELLADGLLTGQGFLSRVLVTAPDTTAGTRFWHEPKPESSQAIKAYGGRLLSILEVSPPLADGKPNELKPDPLEMSPRTKEAWTQFADHVEGQMGNP